MAACGRDEDDEIKRSKQGQSAARHGGIGASETRRSVARRTGRKRLSFG